MRLQRSCLVQEFRKGRALCGMGLEEMVYEQEGEEREKKEEGVPGASAPSRKGMTRRRTPCQPQTSCRAKIWAEMRTSFPGNGREGGACRMRGSWIWIHGKASPCLLSPAISLSPVPAATQQGELSPGSLHLDPLPQFSRCQRRPPGLKR